MELGSEPAQAGVAGLGGVLRAREPVPAKDRVATTAGPTRGPRRAEEGAQREALCPPPAHPPSPGL